jgi:hypothetical protein
MRFVNILATALALCFSMHLTSLTAHTEQKASLSQQQICKAALGTIMDRDPSLMTITKVEAGVVYLNYIRKGDDSRWAYRCKIDGDRVIWASDTDRWRSDSQDEIVTFSYDSNSLIIKDKYIDGSSTIKTFKLSQLGQ